MLLQVPSFGPTIHSSKIYIKYSFAYDALNNLPSTLHPLDTN